MREIRLSGSEGGETAIKAVFPTPINNASPIKGGTDILVCGLSTGGNACVSLGDSKAGGRPSWPPSVASRQDVRSRLFFRISLSMGASKPATKGRNSEAQNQPVIYRVITSNNLSCQ